MIGTFLVLGTMALCALVPFFTTTRLVERGKSGAALSIVSVLGAIFVILMYATNNTFGLDPIKAISWALLFALPATLGGCAGGLLGWMIRRRKDRSIK